MFCRQSNSNSEKNSRSLDRGGTYDVIFRLPVRMIYRWSWATRDVWDLTLLNSQISFHTVRIGVSWLWKRSWRTNGGNVSISVFCCCFFFCTYLTQRSRMSYKQFLWPSLAFLLSWDLCSCHDAYCTLVLRSRGIHARNQALRVPWDQLKHCIQRRIHLAVERC